MSFITDTLEDTKTRVKEIVSTSNAPSRVVIARYTAAVAVNFTEWMGRSIPWIRHEEACFLLKKNLRCEVANDHIGMLHRFAQQADASPNAEDYSYVSVEVGNIRNFLSDPAFIGLRGATLCAALENTSLVFIPDLADRAWDLGVADLEYTRVHGAADQEHASDLLRAVECESGMSYHDAKHAIWYPCQLVVDLLDKIYS